MSATTMRVVECLLVDETEVEECARCTEVVVHPLSAHEDAEAICPKCFRDFQKMIAKMDGVTVHKPDASPYVRVRSPCLPSSVPTYHAFLWFPVRPGGAERDRPAGRCGAVTDVRTEKPPVVTRRHSSSAYAGVGYSSPW
jgi:hypothetical protein